MKKLTHTLTLFTLGAIFLAFTQGCRKYPEDNTRYWFKSPVKRLQQYGWNLDIYYINGVDSITSLMHRYYYIDPTLASGYHLFLGTSNKHKTGIDFNGGFGSGSINLTDHKNKLNIQVSVTPGYYNPFINSSTDWEIRELTTDVLKIKSTINGILYEIVFKRA